MTSLEERVKNLENIWENNRKILEKILKDVGKTLEKVDSFKTEIRHENNCFQLPQEVENPKKTVNVKDMLLTKKKSKLIKTRTEKNKR